LPLPFAFAFCLCLLPLPFVFAFAFAFAFAFECHPEAKNPSTAQIFRAAGGPYKPVFGLCGAVDVALVPVSVSRLFG
jgi:hypothetical protein